MKEILVNLPDASTLYVPVPCRGILKGMKAVFQSNTVEVGDTIVAYRDTTAVNTLTATDTAGLIVETGVPDTTNKDLVFDPDSTTALYKMIKLVNTGAPGAALVLLQYDEYASVYQAPLEA
jgi:hypothetical protein